MYPTANAIGTAPAPVVVQPTLWGHDDVAATEVHAPWIALDDHSSVLHQPNWLVGADAAYDHILASTPWRCLRRPMYDRVVDVPRRIATVARSDVACGSRLASIVEGVEALLGVSAVHIGLNHYRGGADSVTWHRDRIGDQRDWSVVALVSLGGPRTLRMRPWVGRREAPTAGATTSSTRRFPLASGDLFIMAGACQRDWEHAVLKTASAAPRISIALRSRQFPQGPLFQQRGVPPLTD